MSLNKDAAAKLLCSVIRSYFKSQPTQSEDSYVILNKLKTVRFPLSVLVRGLFKIKLWRGMLILGGPKILLITVPYFIWKLSFPITIRTIPRLSLFSPHFLNIQMYLTMEPLFVWICYRQARLVENIKGGQAHTVSNQCLFSCSHFYLSYLMIWISSCLRFDRGSRRQTSLYAQIQVADIKGL